MYKLIGDFIRTGDTIKDPLHSVHVAGKLDRLQHKIAQRENLPLIIHSINRTRGGISSNKLMLHTWIFNPDTYECQPVLSTPHATMKETFLQWESSEKERLTKKV